MGSTVTRYSPVYSYIIAFIYKIFGPNMYHVFFFQMILGVLNTYILYKTATLLFNNSKIGLIAALIGALYSPLIFCEGTLIRASIIATCNLAGFYFLLLGLKKLKPQYYLSAGILIGLSLVLRPNILPLVVIPYIFFALKSPLKSKMITILLFLLGVIIVSTPLAVRNRILKKDVLISYQGPSTFWIGNTHDSSGIGLWRSPLRGQLATEAHGSISKTIGILIREIKQHPKDYMHLYQRKIKMYLNAYEIPANVSYDQFMENHPSLRLALFNFAIICPLALLGIILCIYKYQNIGLLYLLLSTLSISVIIFHIQGRYRIPAVPFFIILSAYSAYWIIYSLKQKRKSALLCLAVLFFFTLTTAPDHKIIKHFFGKRVRVIDYENLAIAYYQLYEYEGHAMTDNQKKSILLKAILNEEKAEQYYPKEDTDNKTLLLIRKGIYYLEMNDKENATRNFEEAFLLAPHYKEEMKELITKKYVYKKSSLEDLSFKTFISSRGFQNIFK